MNDEYEFAFKEVVRTENGRKVLWQLIQDCGVFSSAYEPDPYKQQYMGGVKSVGLRIYNDLAEKHPQYFDMMIQESRITTTDE